LVNNPLYLRPVSLFQKIKQNAIHMAEKKNDCKPCDSRKKMLFPKDTMTWFPGFLLVALPKCPFCFMAFSSTMLLCGEGTTMVSERVHQSSPTIWLSALFCAAALAGILLVRRDIRTFYAFLLAVTGSVMVMTSVLKAGGMPLYYAGTVVIFFGVWLNSSLISVLKKAGILPAGRLIRVPSK
jgi:hypothetical protein